MKILYIQFSIITFVSDVGTDAEKTISEECSSDISKITPYSAQAIVTVALKRITFRSLSYNTLVKVAKVLGVKARGKGKYDLAEKMATELVEQKYVEIAEGGNFIALKRDAIKLSADNPR